MTVEMIETSATGALAGRLFGAGVGALELCGVYVGIRLDLYRTLADGPLSAAELAARTGCAERYLREWLQHQAVAGLLTADGADPTTARFALADGVTDVLVDETGPAYLGGLPRALAAVGRVLPALVDDFGCGPGWSAIELAKAFRHLRVDGLDNDDASIAAARRNAVAHGVADRVTMEVRDLGDATADWTPRHDVVFFFECVHDLP